MRNFEVFMTAAKRNLWIRASTNFGQRILFWSPALLATPKLSEGGSGAGHGDRAPWLQFTSDDMQDVLL